MIMRGTLEGKRDVGSGLRSDGKLSQHADAKPKRQVLGLSARRAFRALQILIHGVFSGVSCEVGLGCSHLERREARAGWPPLLPAVSHQAAPATQQL